MQIYLLAAEKDQDVARELETFLKRHGCMVRLAIGQAMFHPARHGEMTIGLWSMNTRMSAHQITFTNRAIDAVVSGSLVIGQLDFHPLPYGLTDVEPFDLRSPGMRNMRFQQMLAELRKVQRAQLNAPSVNSDSGGGQGGPGDSIEDAVAEAPSQPDAPPVTDIFVSYAYANREIVWPLVEELQGADATIWIDREGLKPGTSWAGNIVRAIKTSNLFCLMCSSQSYASDNVRREIYLADKYEKPILPVLLDSAIMPEDIEYFLIDRQWLDLARLDQESRSSELIKAFAA